MKNFRKISGVSLLEVLITILVVAVGMLAYAALQVKTVNVTQESYYRSQAITVLEEATSKMRANSEFIANDAANVYVNNSGNATFHEWCSFAGTPVRPTLSCTSNCSDAELAQYNIESSCIQLFDTGVANARMGAACYDIDNGSGSADADSCTVGSKYKMYVAWTPTVRQDTDGSDTYSESSICQTVVGMASDYSCVIVDIIP